MSAFHHQKRRKIVLVSPRLQGGVALGLAALVLLAAAIFGVLVYRDVARALRDVSLFGHYRFRSSYEVVAPGVVRHLAGLFAGTLVAGVALFLLVIRRIRAGTERIAAVFRLSGEGDLSTPTDAPGPGEFADLGEQLDEARRGTLEAIDGIRAEVDLMRKEPLAEDEFLKRWDGVKERIRRIAP
ncbi:MAG: hypothetical protein ACM3NF_11050 [Gemmatimonadota bacterium]